MYKSTRIERFLVFVEDMNPNFKYARSGVHFTCWRNVAENGTNMRASCRRFARGHRSSTTAFRGANSVNSVGNQRLGHESTEMQYQDHSGLGSEDIGQC